MSREFFAKREFILGSSGWHREVLAMKILALTLCCVINFSLAIVIGIHAPDQWGKMIALFNAAIGGFNLRTLIEVTCESLSPDESEECDANLT
jgi:hypothetical protein